MKHAKGKSEGVCQYFPTALGRLAKSGLNWSLKQLLEKEAKYGKDYSLVLSVISFSSPESQKLK